MGLGLSHAEVGLIRPAYPDFGQVFYLVDSDFRTAAQGWSQADRTGPLDLYEARKAGRGGTQYVYRDGDYTTTAVALQAAIDGMVDFRGDALYFTPGAYTVATARTIDVPDARWLGPPVSHAANARATITASVANALAVDAAADRMEIAYLQFVPLTAAAMWDVAAIKGLHAHHNYYNSDGIAASTATIFWTFATTAGDLVFENDYIVNDAAQGEWINCEGITTQIRVKDFEIYLQAGTWAAAIDFAGVGVVNFAVGPGIITGTGAAALTSLITAADKTQGTTHGFTYGIRSSTSGPAATSLTVATGLAAELDILDCHRAVATDTANTATSYPWLPFTG